MHGYIIGDKSDEGQDALPVEVGNVDDLIRIEDYVIKNHYVIVLGALFGVCQVAIDIGGENEDIGIQCTFC